jgi:DNA-binding Lrp family transcriptional regulator
MATDPLAILFGSAARVKLLRFFVFNPHKVETFDEVSKRARLVRRTARTEMTTLEKAGIIKKRTIYIPVPDKSKKMKAVGYTLDKSFSHLSALQSFLFATAPINGKTLLRHLRTAGTLDFVTSAGVFVQEFEHRLDVMVAMKKLDETKVANAIRALEAELGIDIKFAAMTTEDLRYRIGMHDKLIRDVFDYSHEILVDKAGIRGELGVF